MKVVHIIDDLGLGGAQRQLVALLKGMPRDRVEIHLIALSDKKCAYENAVRDLGIPLTIIDQSGKWSWGAFWGVRKKLIELQPDIIHTWLFTADFYGRVAAFSVGFRNIISAMRNTVDDMPWHYRIVSQLLSLGTKRITVNADAIRYDLVNAMGISNSKIRTIYNGIDLEEFDAPQSNGRYREEWQIPSNGKVIAMAARMAAQKDYFTFLRAAQMVKKEFPKAYFLLIGDGPLRPEIEERVKALGLEACVRLLGARRDVWSILKHVDICVLASHFEGCSNSVMEAMAAGKPVIATNVGGNSELISDGESGWVVPPQNFDAMANALLLLLRDAKRAGDMGSRGRLRVEKHFTLGTTVRQTEDLYRELLVEGEK